MFWQVDCARCFHVYFHLTHANPTKNRWPYSQFTGKETEFVARRRAQGFEVQGLFTCVLFVFQ